MNQDRVEQEQNTLPTRSQVISSEIHWIEEACAICSSRQSDKIAETPDLELEINIPFSVRKCCECGLVYTSPRPSMDDLLKYFYPEDYTCYRPNLKSVSQYALARFIEFSRRKVVSKMRCRTFFKFYPQNLKINFLDVGCSYGQLLEGLQEYSQWNLFGLEPNIEVCKMARDKGLQVVDRTLEDSGFPDDYFQIINFSHVFEHLDDPIRAIKVTRRLLAEEGLAMIEVPNIDSIESKLFGNNWWGLHLPRHLYHYTPQTLSRLLRQEGLEIVQCQYLPTPSVWGWSVQYLFKKWEKSFPVKKVFSQNNPLIPLFFLPLDLLTIFLRSSSTFRIVAKKRARVH